jgi:hypothetical protein
MGDESYKKKKYGIVFHKLLIGDLIDFFIAHNLLNMVQCAVNTGT